MKETAYILCSLKIKILTVRQFNDGHRGVFWLYKCYAAKKERLHEILSKLIVVIQATFLEIKVRTSTF